MVLNVSKPSSDLVQSRVLEASQSDASSPFVVKNNASGRVEVYVEQFAFSHLLAAPRTPYPRNPKAWKNALGVGRDENFPVDHILEKRRPEIRNLTASRSRVSRLTGRPFLLPDPARVWRSLPRIVHGTTGRMLAQ